MPNDWATVPGGKLVDLKDCFLSVPGFGEITLNILPDISDAKSVTYQDEPAIGRTTPIKTYSYSDNRVINITFYFIVAEQADVFKNLGYIAAIQSCAYPRQAGGGVPYKPPPICKFKCGLLTRNGGFESELCVVLKSYDIKYNKDYPWDVDTYLPYYVEVSTTWDVVYDSASLPGQEQILALS
jgi:hypothetical protein